MYWGMPEHCRVGDAVFIGDLAGKFYLKRELFPDLGNVFLPFQEKKDGKFEI